MLLIGREGGQDGGRRAAVAPGDHLVAGVEPGLEPVRRRGVVEAVAHVVLARPHHLHGRAAQLPGQERRLDGEVALGLAAEAAAQQRRLHGDLGRGHAQRRGDVVAGLAGALHRRPDLPLAVAHARRRCRRLHGGVVEVGRVVLARDHLGGRGQRLVDVADVALDLAGLLDGGFELRPVGLGVVGLVRPVVPGDLERLAALERGPGVPGDDGHAAQRPELVGRRRRLQRDDLLHARHLQGRAGIDRGHLAAHHRRPGDDRELHAGQHDVLAVDGLAGGDVDEIGDADGALADVAEGARLLQLDLVGGRHRQARRGGGELAVAQLAAGRLVHDLVQLRLHLAHVHLPLGGGRLLQHGCRAAAPHWRIGWIQWRTLREPSVSWLP